MNAVTPAARTQGRYAASEAFLERAQAVIPLGSQTFSKSRTQFPVGAAPLFADRGEGPYLYDIDGNRYVDLICSLGAITLGHGDPDVNAAVRAQLDRGVLFSLASPIETELAEMICAMVPSAERVRFGKNGSDATAGAVRLARAYTKRDLVAVCGYHGWQDWYIGTTTRDAGVPDATKSLTKKFAYNDIDSLAALFAAHPGEFAAVIMEPMAFDLPKDDFLHKVQDLCRRNGTLFVLDEIVTGFRFPPGTAQQMFGIEPDLTALGKGLANGFPLSAVAGRAEIMQLMEEIFFSFTMGGETLSLAAAVACLTKARRDNTLEKTAQTGASLSDQARALIRKHGLEDAVALNGHPTWGCFIFRDQPGINSFEMKTLFMQEALARGVLTIGIQFLSAAHGPREVDFVLGVYDEVFGILAKARGRNSIDGLLRCKPLQPLFKVR